MFRLKEIWESSHISNEEFSPDAFCSFLFDHQTCISVGSLSGIIRFYFPSKASDQAPFTEIILNYPILQISYGNFIFSDKSTLAVLHPNLLILYEIESKENTIVLNESQSYSFSHSSYNFISTTFDGPSKPQCIIIQSLDGFLTIANSLGTTAYKIPYFFLPMPFTYIPPLELFIFGSPDYKVYGYRKNILLSSSSDNKSIEDWNYLIGEQIVSIHFWQLKTKYVTAASYEIAVVGERTLYILNENGNLKSIVSLNMCAISALSYTSQNEKGKNCNNLLISGKENTLCIYINFQKVWQLNLTKAAIALNIITIEPNPGFLALLTEDGTVVVGYVGTHDQQILPLPKIPKITEQQVKEQIIKINERISKIPSTDFFQIFVNVSKASPRFVEIIFQSKFEVNDVMCQIEVPPTITKVSSFTIEKVGKDEVPFRIEFSPTDKPPARQNIIISTIFTTAEKKMLTKFVEFEIPFEFFIRKIETRVKGNFKLILNAKGGFLSLAELFPNQVLKKPHELSMTLTNGEIVSISIDSKAKRYRVEADTYGQLGFVLSTLILSVNRHSKGIKLSINEKVDASFLLSVAQEHYELRQQERELQQKIHSHVTELENIQKALIGKYEAATPEPLDELNSLLQNTSNILKDEVQKILQLQKQINDFGAVIEANVFTFIIILVLSFDLNDEESKLVRTYIPMHSENCSPGWEECAFVGINALIKKLKNVDSGKTVSSTPEILSDFDFLVQAFEALIRTLENRKKRK
ncbi:protein PTHB1 isoform X2 [Histomonas meleagridis]|uniref:protein PTHB1 isoform X2 n=1 Tax=Histomonas meleagridis TaxID=135588 RepID=UPI0035598C6F|nr:protein PTHB1 isoform X2 [Histomonas meleagridis]KAH0807188.1 protein PTHB1 isoform X2 [Histomonas meleagridis]